MPFFRSFASFIQSALDIILPRKERAVRIDHYTAEDFVVVPTEHSVHGTTIVTLSSYREKAIEDCVRALKYDASHYAMRLCADMLSEYLREELSSVRMFSSKPVLLIPVPLHPLRHRERGFNQIESVLNHLPQEFHDGRLSRIESGALVRVRETKPQTRLGRMERMSNVKGAFAVSDHTTVLSAHVILIDDVMTTGATLAEAGRPLANLGVSVSLLALARA